MPREAGRQETRERQIAKIKTSQVINRLRDNIMGKLPQANQVADGIIDKQLLPLLTEIVQADELISLTVRQRQGVRKALKDMLERCRLDMGQVRSGEILLKKSLPDLNTVEYEGKGRDRAIVLVPVTSTPEQWAEQVERPLALGQKENELDQLNVVEGEFEEVEVK